MEEEALLGVLAEEQGTLLRAGGAQVKGLAGKGAEELVAAFGIHTSDAGHTLAVLFAFSSVSF